MRDFIVVGCGLAGLSVAEELRKRGKSYKVLDSGNKGASRVAGGIINPLILKFFTKAWRADEFVPAAMDFYGRLENQLKIEALHQIPIYRKLSSIREQNDWVSASGKPHLREFVDGAIKSIKHIPAEFGYGEVKKSAFLDADLLLETYQSALAKEGSLIKECFDFHQLKIGKDGVDYRGLKAKKMIFCEGMGLLVNPFFDFLPLIGNKGEYLILRFPTLELNVILKSSVALIPLGDGLYKCGATYQRQYRDNNPETENRLALIEKLDTLIDKPYEIVESLAGIRPTVPDRRPLLGRHPKFHNIFVMNGLGSHGLMVAPTAAKWLADFALADKPLPEEVAISRFASA